MKWRRLNGDPLNGDIHSEVEYALRNEASRGFKLKVCIGTDSQVKGAMVEFATAIVFVREKNGGFMFLNVERIKNTLSIKERMLTEVYKSIGIAYELCPLLDRYQVELEVHADINTSPNHKSNIALHEAMGYIVGMGFTFKAKPDAFASSYCANKVVH